VTEVNELLAGSVAQGVDAADLKRHTKYSGYTPLSAPVRLFWSVFKGLSPDDRRAVLKFVTGTRRAPLGGFAHLSPPFTLARVDCDASVFAHVGGKDVARLPTASTCFNTLKLPNYRRAATLRERLLYAVHSRAGFDLS
jgi:HECT-domain (ubiquitin-transferase)